MIKEIYVDAALWLGIPILILLLLCLAYRASQRSCSMCGGPAKPMYRVHAAGKVRTVCGNCRGPIVRLERAGRG